MTAQIVTASTCRARQMSLSFGPLNSTRSCAPNAAQPVPPVTGRLPRPLTGATIHHRCAQRPGGREEPHCHTEAVALSRPSSPYWRPFCSRRSRRPLPPRRTPRISTDSCTPSARWNRVATTRRATASPAHTAGTRSCRQLEAAGHEGRSAPACEADPRMQETSRAARSTACTTGWIWRRVAYWWLTGSSKTSGWSQFASRYVKNVMAIYNGRHREIASTAACAAIPRGARDRVHGLVGTRRAPSYRGDPSARRNAKATPPRSASPGARSPGTGPRADARQSEGVPRWPVREDRRPVSARSTRATGSTPRPSLNPGRTP